MAAQAIGVEPGQIAKTMALELKDQIILINGAVKIDLSMLENITNGIWVDVCKE
ncbi:MAG: hypothetical protein ACRC92_19730 [Peptostreptococcaceae bacterium]